EIESRGLDRHPLAARAILGEELLELDALDLLVVLLQQRPGRARAQCRHRHRSFPREIRLPETFVCPRLGQLALRIAVRLESMRAIRSSHDLTKDDAPSSCSRAASASMSMPALANLARPASQ